MGKSTGKTEVSRKVISSKPPPVNSIWDGPHFQVSGAGLNVFRETMPPYGMFLDALETTGCWEYVISGSLYYRLGNQRYRINAGEALIMRRPNPGWLVRQVEGTPLRTLTVFVRDRAALRMFDYLHSNYGAIQQFSLDSPVVRLARQIVRLIWEKRIRSAHFVSEKIFRWLSAWWQYAEEHHGSWNREEMGILGPSKVVSQVPATVKGFAAQMGYSRAHLTRKLKQQWTCSPGLVLREVRLQFGASLLRSTHLSIGEIATRAGYGSPVAFGRAFLRLYQQTPRAYRYSHQ